MDRVTDGNTNFTDHRLGIESDDGRLSTKLQRQMAAADVQTRDRNVESIRKEIPEIIAQFSNHTRTFP